VSNINNAAKQKDMKKVLRARAPAKVILFGEHYVVYGASGLVAAIEPCNEIELKVEEAGRQGAGLQYRSTRAENNISIDLNRPSANSKHPYCALYLKLAKELPALRELRISAQVKHAWQLKGVGNSASLGAALGAGLRKAAGEKSLSANILFEDAQTADEVAHGGGRPSGIDAAAAAYGNVMEFQKDFANPLRPKIRALKMAPMRKVGFLLIDTHKDGEKRASTGALVAAFGRAHGIEKKPAELSARQREEVCAPYAPLFAHAKNALEKGEWDIVGLMMDEDHKLLRNKGVSSTGIEKAVGVAKSFGALGAKLSGAGGEGGVVIALVEKEKMPDVRLALDLAKFGTYEFRIAKSGAKSK